MPVMNNPLISQTNPAELNKFINFTQLQAKDFLPALEEQLANYKHQLEQCLAEDKFTWANFYQPLEAAEDQLEQIWRTINHLNNVVNTDAIREAYQACLPKMTEFSSWLGQHQDLYNAFKQLHSNSDKLDQAQQQSLENSLLSFRLAGVSLPEEEQQEFAANQQRLAELSNSFSNNLLDATQAFTKLITDEAELAGLPATALASAKQAAEAKGETGWLFTLDFPSYLPVMTYAENRQLRQEMYLAFVTRASELGLQADKLDNSPVMEEILQLRQAQAKLLGYNNYAEVSLARKMASSTDEVLHFLQELTEKAYPQAQAEIQELADFAQQAKGVESLAKLEAWDIAFYSEKLRQQKFNLSQEEVRPWFPAPKVISGLFQLTQQLFDVEITEQTHFPSWNTDVTYYEVSHQGEVISGFYLDLYAREGKRGGAWMAEAKNRRLTAAGTQLPIAYLNCNFTPPVGDEPSLLTHTEVLTLLHEFGHGLHHLLTKVGVSAVAGINGVAWDAVELPSQFMENFAWHADGLKLLASHVETGEPLPAEMLDKLLAAKNFQSAMALVRQLEFALFDFQLHLLADAPKAAGIQQLLDAVRQKVSVVPLAEENRFQHGFSHIFAGGYAAGYYSYKWAEVLSADAFAAFEEAFDKKLSTNLLNPELGRKFKQAILEQGGSAPAMELFTQFRGRQPSLAALLRHSGIRAA